MGYLELHDIHKSYYLGSEEFKVLKGIDLSFELGEFVSILGESGGGKSTLMNIIGGLDRNFTGSVTVNGETLNHRDTQSLDRYRRETVGYIYQSYNLISHLTIYENVLISLEMTTMDRQAKHDRAMQLLADVGLTEQVHKYPNQLSGGQKQRVAIARALASDPKVIIADEPTGALDEQNTEEVLQILNKIAADGRLVIAVTHSQAVADSGTRIVHLVDGHLTDEVQVRPKANVAQPEQLTGFRKLPAMVAYKTAFKHLKHTMNWNALIIAGTAIGLFAVMLFLGLGNGLKGYINEQVNKMVNPQIVTVTRKTAGQTTKNSRASAAANQQGGGAAMGGGAAAQAQAAQSATGTTTTATLTDAQIAKLKKQAHVQSVEKNYNTSDVTYKYGNKKLGTAKLTTWTSNNHTSTIKVGTQPGKNQIVVDKKTLAKTYSSKNWRKLLGKKITVKFTTKNKNGKQVTVNKTLTVAGITDATTGSVTAISNATEQSWIKQYHLKSQPDTVIVKATNRNYTKSLTTKIGKLKVNGKKVFSATSASSMIATVNQYVNLATVILAAIAAISLVVSALMIIVTMFMSVSSRTKEIGVLRALGESKTDIRRLFTSESLMIGLASAIIGTGVAYAVAYGLNQVLYAIASYNLIQIEPQNIILTFGLALVISLFAAWLPARKAARLNPIDALAAE
ncbi:ATP-binding cassette domain-containing protein [Lactiplantibacillus fabifermentans]|uniref:ABC transporter, ATP-binding and permease protein n=2 Tax=Lactiplantibacillus fabifermentans TaxID=483011 RepID=A0A0R2NBG4_9LACO|nr:ABC transporter ATP-binding protein/permease [Lactiplantibacillus fabifermentans]ETY73198.1 ABC transporter ATP-binding protein [Lactiplantibacillus fabifermentans T30PCM01]KRO23239.1 ABC transporter, ATP-binding and permease protein [Lactiplantibacillus fabifermentans DSM 21115]